ncbi:MAG: DinB family protein [Anaerolineales bacterium]|nr:DinB family protein [Anaerolineales bacterium]
MPENYEKEKEELIAQLEAARARLNAALARLDAESFIYPSWKMKELLDHIAGWDDAVIAALRSHAKGDVPAVTAPRGIDYYNAQTVETRESLPLEHSRREFDATREVLKKTLRDLPDEKFPQTFVSPWGTQANVKGIVGVFVHHEGEHAGDIEKLLENGG